MSAGKRLGAAALAIIALVFAAVAFGGGAASAYPSGSVPTISLDHSSGPVGDKVVVTGQGFTANKQATLTFHSNDVALGSVAISATGTFTDTITVPNVALGGHQVEALDQASNSTASAAFDVTGEGAGGGGGLANTGVAVLGIASLGLVLLVGGGLMLMAGRRRKVAA